MAVRNLPSCDFPVVVFCSFILWEGSTSINQSNIIVPTSPVKPGSLAQQPDQCSTTKWIKQFCNNYGANVCSGVYGGKDKSKRCVLRLFLKAVTEVAEPMDSGRLFQREGVQE